MFLLVLMSSLKSMVLASASPNVSTWDIYGIRVYVHLMERPGHLVSISSKVRPSHCQVYFCDSWFTCTVRWCGCAMVLAVTWALSGDWNMASAVYPSSPGLFFCLFNAQRIQLDIRRALKAWPISFHVVCPCLTKYKMFIDELIPPQQGFSRAYLNSVLEKV